MVRIRLIRVGGKKQPSYRVVAIDRESPRNGRYLEKLGFYNPRTEPFTLSINEGRVYDWMKNGAQPTDSVKQLFQTAGVIDRYERFKTGESLETLLNEASVAAQTRNVGTKTRLD